MNNQQMNSVSLSVKDFQIIKSANLSFLPGLNCIIGQSNNGKSALMRAAKACIYNTTGTNSVRLGCSNFAVGLQMNGHTVILQKGNNSLYKIDNEVYGKIGRTQLEEVASALGIRELSINGSNEDINFWDQMEKPFLLDRSETELFRFIVDSGKDNNITTALKTITQDRQQITKDIAIAEGKIAQIEDNIKRQDEELKDSDIILATCNRVIELGPKIKRAQELTNLKNKSLLDGQNLSLVISEYNKVSKALTDTDDSFNKINLNMKKFDLISNISSRINKSQTKLDLLNTEYNKIKHLDIPDLNEKFSKYKTLGELITKLRVTSGLIQELSSKKFPEITDNFGLKIQKLSAISALVSSINNKQDLISKSNQELNNINKEIDELDKEIKSIGICPMCGQPIHNN